MTHDFNAQQSFFALEGSPRQTRGSFNETKFDTQQFSADAQGIFLAPGSWLAQVKAPASQLDLHLLVSGIAMKTIKGFWSVCAARFPFFLQNEWLTKN